MKYPLALNSGSDGDAGFIVAPGETQTVVGRPHWDMVRSYRPTAYVVGALVPGAKFHLVELNRDIEAAPNTAALVREGKPPGFALELDLEADPAPAWGVRSDGSYTLTVRNTGAVPSPFVSSMYGDVERR